MTDRTAPADTRVTGARRARWWTAVAASALVALSVLAAAPAHAEDPKAAAEAIGRVGNTAAGAIARDASNAATVPGYAGTDLPERNLGGGSMEDAARARLADPHDPGGAAGRAVIGGTLSRPAAEVPPGDPAAMRADGIAADPQAAAHGAAGLASGSAAGCAAGLAQAGDGGSCGAVRWCAGAGCGRVEPQANTGFGDAISRLNMAIELGGEEFDRDDLRFFKGNRRTCNIRWGGLANCCTDSGLLVGLAGCRASERELAEDRHAGNTRYLGSYCARRTFFGFCTRRARAWCVFGSRLGRILQEQGRAQLGVGWSSCRGLSVAEIERLDFASLDLSEFTGNLTDGSMEPSVSLPDADGAGAAMRARIRDFYSRSR